MTFDPNTGKPTNRTYLECGLPPYLVESLHAMKACWERLDHSIEDLRWDCYYCSLQADINSAEVNQTISTEQAWYLRETYLRIEREVFVVPDSYYLRIFDTDLIRFTLEDGGLAGLKATILSVNELQRHRLPLDLQLEKDGGLVRWLERRVIPKNRAFVTEILKSLRLAQGDTRGIIDVCKGLSLNDSYWVVPDGFEGKFANYNLYENHFSEILSLVAYTGAQQSDTDFTTSPELTTNGMLPKAWRHMGDGIYLYKGGTSGASNTGREPYSEYYACQIGKAMGLNAIQYGLEQWKGILASTCELFTSQDVSFIPIGRLVKGGGLPAVLSWYEFFGPDAFEQVKSMLVFDAIIYNEDRHFGNFGVLRDNHTGNILGMAPIFDHGLSLFNYATQSDYADLGEYAKTRTSAYNIPFDIICKEVMGTVQKAQLRKLIGFTFDRHPRLNLSEEALQAIETQVQNRVRDLLELTPERTKPIKKHREAR